MDQTQPKYKHTCQACFDRDNELTYEQDQYGYWHYTCPCGHTGTFTEAKEVKHYWQTD